ncbi:MAG: hypothetical protein AAGA44_15495 [Pseudomonadota bacterium]
MSDSPEVAGEFVDLDGERYYVIRNVDRMPPFFISVVSNDDHWLFVSSTGGLTAGRVSPDTALFPYITVDKIHDSTTHTGSLTLTRVHGAGHPQEWDPFTSNQAGRYTITRNLYKSILGNKLCFEEMNHDLGLVFRYTWQTSGQYGFVRSCELGNLKNQPIDIEVLDGLQNILPAGTPRYTQTNSSNLVDAYKWTEYDDSSGLALFTLFSGITDRAEPCESLKANVAYCVGLEAPQVLISSEQIYRFKDVQDFEPETIKRGVRGAFLLRSNLSIPAGDSVTWQIVTNSEQTQSEVAALRHELADKATHTEAIRDSVDEGSEELARIMASSDGFQITAEETVATHHYANVLFNVLRGGVFSDQYRINRADLARTVQAFNHPVYERNRDLLSGLPQQLTATELLQTVRKAGDGQLLRLCYEYLPITFGRRHGDPSRPWNQFAIRLRDRHGNALLSYEGNWRDIFQNWEALALSYPEFIESMIAKFVNASTVDGYNPYRITKEGIDWEVEDPEDPWSYIGYWGDHQIIYLQKLLELSRDFHPRRLSELLHTPIFCYANVPYRIRSFSALLDDPKATVDYADAHASCIEKRLETLGADGKLLLDAKGQVYQVSLLEKLLVPLLAKLGNFVIDGGIWMNTQRPEWNDANNALVGQGLSMVTLFYLRRYVAFLDDLLSSEENAAEISAEVVTWLNQTAKALQDLVPSLGNGPISPDLRFAGLAKLGQASSDFRENIYAKERFSSKVTLATADIRNMLANASTAIDHSIATNRREDGMYHAYNLLEQNDDKIDLGRLYPMLEGQVAALSSGSMPAEVAVEVLECLFASDVYRADQHTFMLYPDRDLPKFLEKNRIPADAVAAIPLVQQLIAEGDDSIISRDRDGTHRFNAEFVNRQNLREALEQLAETHGKADVEAVRPSLEALYEQVFNHQAFTGRSGGMFGFEGLGCIYWHMVAKLLLAVQENFFRALDSNAPEATVQRLGDLYYRVRSGIGFNKSPDTFGAFPYDPYSHTPKHAGAQQPGMTGQVKEELLTRFGELGVRVTNGHARFVPRLLRRREFTSTSQQLRSFNVQGDWQAVEVPADGLAFTWCQVPVVYALGTGSGEIVVTLAEGEAESISGLTLASSFSAEIFKRSGEVRRLDVTIPESLLFVEKNP